jgi:hypothetical protein
VARDGRLVFRPLAAVPGRTYSSKGSELSQL